jgi:hypothetical protein
LYRYTEASEVFCAAVAKRVRPTAMKAFAAAVATASHASADKRRDRRGGGGAH